MKILIAIVFIFTMSGCGKISRGCASWTGNDIVCVEGVKYIQFSSGATVQYDVNGKVVTCQ